MLELVIVKPNNVVYAINLTIFDLACISTEVGLTTFSVVLVVIRFPLIVYQTGGLFP